VAKTAETVFANGGRSKGAQTRQAILDAAIVRFGREGYRATSVADIARDAGVGGTVAYAYFDDKEALFLAAIDEDAAAVIHEGLSTAFGNPELIEWSEEMILGDEGCLSVPQVFDKVPRHARIAVKALDRDGSERRIDAEGLLSVCVQHEMDHLMGKVFVDYLSPLKRNRIRTRMMKKVREEARV